MEYRYLGDSGLRVSVFGFGNWLTGNDPSHEANQIEIMKKAFDAGINYFDTAEIYGNGTAETILGKAIKNFGCKRSDIVVSTKLWMVGNGVNDTFLSRKHILEGITNSLKRLDLEYVDVVFAHRPDYETPLEEICRAFDQIIRQGKAFYWGTSEWPVVWQIRKKQRKEKKKEQPKKRKRKK